MTSLPERIEEILTKFQGYSHNIATESDDFDVTWVLSNKQAKEAILKEMNTARIDELEKFKVDYLDHSLTASPEDFKRSFEFVDARIKELTEGRSWRVNEY